jgi:hypothetical protein
LRQKIFARTQTSIGFRDRKKPKVGAKNYRLTVLAGVCRVILQAATQTICDKPNNLFMKTLICTLSRVRPLLIGIVLFAVTNIAMAATSTSYPVLIKRIVGGVTYSMDGKNWMPVKENSVLDHGVIIKTDANGEMDFILEFSSTVLRLIPDSELKIDRLDRTPVEEVVITDTKLKLMAGSILGFQRKLSHLSRFVIETPDGVARIVGTEYLVRYDGAVSVLSGSVDVVYSKGRKSISVTVKEGQSFDPKTGTVVTTTNEYLRNVLAGIYTFKETVYTFKTKTGGATVTVKTKDESVSKSECDDNDKGGNGGKGGKKDNGGRRWD